VIDPTGKIAYLTRLYDKNEFNGMLQAIKSLSDKQQTAGLN
jgi:hypothetical protein